MARDQRAHPAAAARRWHWLARLRGGRLRGPAACRRPRRSDAVLFDRDGTLVARRALQRRPRRRCEPMPGAREALDRLRAAGVRVGVVTNQSGRGPRAAHRTTRCAAVNARVEDLLGPFDAWQVCPHGDGRRLRLPQAGARPGPAPPPRALGVDAAACVVVGDIGADMRRRAGRRRPRRAGADRA